MKKFYKLKFFALALCLTFFQLSHAQNGAPCYKPVIGAAKGFAAIDAGVSISFTSGNTPDKLINGNTADYAEIDDLLALVSGKGVSVTDSLNTYPAGWHAGFVVETGNDALLNADVLNGMQIQTYNNGAAAETFTVVNGTSVTLLNGSIPGKIYLSFPTTQAFDEIRLIKGTLANLSVGTSLRVYYAMAFDPACGFNENNTICYDQIAGNGSIVNFNGGLLTTLATLADPGNLTDGNRDTYATMVLPVRASLVSTAPYVGVTSLQEVYPGGHKAGFRVQTSTGLLDATLLNSLSIQTYLHGVLQDQAVIGTSGLVNVNLLAGPSAVQEVAITTTVGKPFNEVRLVQTGTSAAINTLRIFEAFESGPSCSDCRTAITTGSAAPYLGNRLTGDRDPGIGVYQRETLLGITIGASLNNPENIATPSLTDSAHYDAVVGVGAGFRMTVGVTGGADYPAGTVAGFAVSVGSGLLEANVIGGFTIKLYRDNSVSPVQTITGGSLVNLGLLTGGSSINFIGGEATVAFDEIEIEYQSLISAGPDIKVYYAYAQLDTDGDGTADCLEVCPTGDDALDSDGDGTPDACDACNTVNPKSPYIDHDGDTSPDACDTDSDGDGIPDTTEDTNGDGDPTNDDADGDGIPNYIDLDSDNDGILDSVETATDTDGDGIPNFLDLDSDNDGLFDLTENGISGAADVNNDGVLDGPDNDNDGIMNSVDQAPSTYGSPGHPAPQQSDADGIPDYLDLDSDNDGTFDIVEAGGATLDANNDGEIDDTTDADGDGIMDVTDRNDTVFGSPGGTILPVTLVNFTATLKNNAALLQWTTTYEQHSSHFEVEKKTKENDWKQVGKVQAAGNSETPIDYTFTDDAPGNGVIQYRLKMADLDGTFTYSPVKTIYNGTAGTALVFPNPVTNGSFQLSAGNFRGQVTIRLADLNGRVVKQVNRMMQPGDVLPISTNGLSAQMYSIHVVGGNGEQLLNTKIIIRN